MCRLALPSQLSPPLLLLLFVKNAGLQQSSFLLSSSLLVAAKSIGFVEFFMAIFKAAADASAFVLLLLLPPSCCCYYGHLRAVVVSASTLLQCILWLKYEGWFLSWPTSFVVVFTPWPVNYKILLILCQYNGWCVLPTPPYLMSLRFFITLKLMPLATPILGNYYLYPIRMSLVLGILTGIIYMMANAILSATLLYKSRL